MKRKLNLTVMIIIIILISFILGWFTKTRFSSKHDKLAYKIASEFVANIQSGKADKAYEMTDQSYKSRISQEAFNKQVADVNSVESLDGVSNLYQNNNMFIFINELTDKDGKTTKIIVVNLIKKNNKVEISGLSL